MKKYDHIVLAGDSPKVLEEWFGYYRVAYNIVADYYNKYAAHSLCANTFDTLYQEYLEKIHEEDNGLVKMIFLSAFPVVVDKFCDDETGSLKTTEVKIPMLTKKSNYQQVSFLYDPSENTDNIPLNTIGKTIGKSINPTNLMGITISTEKSKNPMECIVEIHKTTDCLN